ncbi:hypothetical protein IU448_19000 [Nocardia flavorosea]|uniref:hypothetical protein n=1 Tax=Nocardia flavorosea TaxID=53429 RepID=UPI001893CB6B|nr:hypothetical protein [Nocardia flavorosea]MBF6351087.1 hypothetical protein [Nocardia flavorosea]
MSDTSPGGLPILAPGLGVQPDGVQTQIDTQEAKILAQQGRDSAASSQRLITYASQDPPYITAMEHFEGLSHTEIYEDVQAMNIGAITALGKAWRDISNGLSAKVVGSRLALNRALSEGLEGEFATAAATAADTFFDGADNLQRAVSAVGYRIGSVAGGAEAVRLSVPPPPVRAVSTDGTTDETQQVLTSILGAAAPAADADFARQQEEQRQVAIGVMNTVYKPTYQPAGDGVPTFVPVSAPGDEPTGPGPVGGTTSGPGAPAPGSTTAGQPGENPGGENPSGEQPAAPATEDPQSTTAASTQQQPTTPAGTTPGTPGDPQRGTPVGTTAPGAPSYPGTPGRPSAPGTPGRPGTPQSPLPGRNVPGTPGSPAAPGAATTAAAANRAGRPMGMPGMMSPGGARKGEDEQERRTPDYLIIDRREELLGAEQPTVPPAIGDDAQAAQPADEGGRW